MLPSVTSIVGSSVSRSPLLEPFAGALFLILTLLSALSMVGDYFWLGREIFIHLPARIRDGIHPEFASCAFMLGLSILSAMGADFVIRRNWIGYPLALLVSADLI